MGEERKSNMVNTSNHLNKTHTGTFLVVVYTSVHQSSLENLKP